MQNVFLIDDSMFIITQLSQILKKGGYAVTGYATNGDDAINDFSQKKDGIDIVTLDITMPGKNGIEVLRAIKKIKPEVKVLIVSAIGKKETVMDARNLGAEWYLIKPLSREKVLERFKTLAG